MAIVKLFVILIRLIVGAFQGFFTQLFYLFELHTIASNYERRPQQIWVLKYVSSLAFR